jgi:hypothetical protein
VAHAPGEPLGSAVEAFFPLPVDNQSLKGELQKT